MGQTSGDLDLMICERINPRSHFHLAYSLHELKLTQAAYETLRPVVDRFPEEWRMRFSLACYACQLGKLEEAMMWLEKAMALAGKKEICGMALGGPGSGTAVG
jgi:tetratricopeptide (TPR) repeat protein